MRSRESPVWQAPMESARVAGHYEPAEKNAPPENLWSSEAYMNFIPTLFARLRKEFGNELHLLHDVHHRLTPIEAARRGQRAGAVSSVLDGRSNSGGTARELPPHPSPYDHADSRRRGVQFHLRLPATDSGAVDRLHSRHCCSRRRRLASRKIANLAELTRCAPVVTVPLI